MIYHFGTLREWIPENHETVGDVVLESNYSCGVFTVVALRKRLDHFEGNSSIGLLVGYEVSDCGVVILIEYMLKVFEGDEVCPFLIVDWFSFLGVAMEIEGYFVCYWEWVTDRDELSSEEEHWEAAD